RRLLQECRGRRTTTGRGSSWAIRERPLHSTPLLPPEPLRPRRNRFSRLNPHPPPTHRTRAGGRRPPPKPPTWRGRKPGPPPAPPPAETKALEQTKPDPVPASKPVETAPPPAPTPEKKDAPAKTEAKGGSSAVEYGADAKVEKKDDGSMVVDDKYAIKGEGTK